MRSWNTEPLVLGISVTAVGLVATLGNLGLLDTLATLHRLWPLSLLLWGALDLVRVARLRSRHAPAGAPASEEVQP